MIALNGHNWAYYKSMQIKHIKIYILLCLLINSNIYLNVSAAMSNAKNARLQELLQRARARKAQQKTTLTPALEQSGVLPAESSQTKDVVYEETTKESIELDKSVPKQKDYEDLVEDFNELFKETKSNIEEHKEPVKKVETTTVQTTTTTKQPYVKEKPKTITTTTARPIEAIKKVDTPAVKVETNNTVTQSTVKTESTSQSQIQIIEVEDLEEEEELEEDEFLQEDDEFKDDDEEEDELDETKGLMLMMLKLKQKRLTLLSKKKSKI
jgi:hypothetical protein